MNMSMRSFEKRAAEILSILGNPFRVRLILALSDQEACVCHLEALLKKRQAYISQHLMALRKTGLLETRRDGKYIYYQLSNSRIVDLIKDAAALSGMDIPDIREIKDRKIISKCVCPHCEKNEPKTSTASSGFDLEKV